MKSAEAYWLQMLRKRNERRKGRKLTQKKRRKCNSEKERKRYRKLICMSRRGLGLSVGGMKCGTIEAWHILMKGDITQKIRLEGLEMENVAG